MGRSDKQKWYVATLIVRCIVSDDKPPPHTCDEQVHLLRASDADSAYEKALKLGAKEECTYQNVDGEDVHWRFVGLENQEELEGAIRDGVEIRSRLFDCDDAAYLTPPKSRLSVFLARSNPYSSEYQAPCDDAPQT